MLLATCYMLYDTDYLKLAIACNKIASFRSCSATRSCLLPSHDNRPTWVYSLFTASYDDYSCQNLNTSTNTNTNANTERFSMQIQKDSKSQA